MSQLFFTIITHSQHRLTISNLNNNYTTSQLKWSKKKAKTKLRNELYKVPAYIIPRIQYRILRVRHNLPKAQTYPIHLNVYV